MSEEKYITVTFILDNNKNVIVKAPSGLTVLEIVHEYGENRLTLEGACGGCCACATCHVIPLDDEVNDANEITDNEEDMLDTLDNIEEKSRLGCQVRIMKDCTIRIPTSYRSRFLDI